MWYGQMLSYASRCHKISASKQPHLQCVYADEDHCQILSGDRSADKITRYHYKVYTLDIKYVIR